MTGDGVKQARHLFVAYRVAETAMRIVPANADRAWLNELPSRFGYRCLPLRLANQHGWFLLNSHTFRARWSGGVDKRDITIEFIDGGPPFSAVTHFGSGILTFEIPFLFRTPPGYNLYVRGPANMPKDGIAPLEGVVEADWAVATFTMNWRFTRPDEWVSFDRDEPVAMIAPVRRGDLESMSPEERRIENAPELSEAYGTWHTSRELFLVEHQLGHHTSTSESWEKHYTMGTSYPGGPKVTTPQQRLTLQEFRRTDARDEPVSTIPKLEEQP
ncbi:MAG: DUF6065 family protein [Gemmatimonadaceae bacterium]